MGDTRRDQLIDFIEKEFIGPDPIDWPGMTQSNGEEILTTDPPRIRYIAGILYPRETTDTDVDTREGESEPVGASDDEDHGDVPVKGSGSATEFLEDAEELINRSNAYRQSAMSITVAIKKDDEIRAEVSAGTYATLTRTDPKTDWLKFSYREKSVIEQAVLLAGVLHKMCSVQLVRKARSLGEIESVNRVAIETAKTEGKIAMETVSKTHMRLPKMFG